MRLKSDQIVHILDYSCLTNNIPIAFAIIQSLLLSWVNAVSQ